MLPYCLCPQVLLFFGKRGQELTFIAYYFQVLYEIILFNHNSNLCRWLLFSHFTLRGNWSSQRWSTCLGQTADKELSLDLKPVSDFKARLFSLYLIASLKVRASPGFCILLFKLLVGLLKWFIHNNYTVYIPNLTKRWCCIWLHYGYRPWSLKFGLFVLFWGVECVCVCGVWYACWFLVVGLIFEKLVLLLHNNKNKNKNWGLANLVVKLKNHTVSLTSALVSHFHVDVWFRVLSLWAGSGKASLQSKQ